MSSEQNVSEVPSHQPPPPNAGGDPAPSTANQGTGQSKSSRRRRRKRKGRGPEEMAGGENATSGAGVMPTMQAQAAPSNGASHQGARDGATQTAGSANGSSQGNGAYGGSQQGNGQGGFGGRDQANGGKRWKKRFRDRDRPQRGGTTDNPGNQASPQVSAPSNGSGSGFGGGFGGGSVASRDTNTHQFGNRSDGFKRKGSSSSSGGGKRERGPRSFVGPMDHSYRAASSSDGASTVEGFLGGWSRTAHKGDSQPIDYSQGRAVPIADDAPTRIYFFIEDLFFYAKINETARKLGVKISFVKSDKDSVAELLALEEDARPGLIVVDLNNANAKPLTLIPKIKAKFKRQTSIIGFLSHLQGDLKAKAVESGCDTVMPRAAFSQNLPNLLRRYGIEEEHEEDNFNS